MLAKVFLRSLNRKSIKELKYAHINNIENYEQYYQYLTKDLDFKAEETLYRDYKDFNFNDTEPTNLLMPTKDC